MEHPIFLSSQATLWELGRPAKAASHIVSELKNACKSNSSPTPSNFSSDYYEYNSYNFHSEEKLKAI